MTPLTSWLLLLQRGLMVVKNISQAATLIRLSLLVQLPTPKTKAMDMTPPTSWFLQRGPMVVKNKSNAATLIRLPLLVQQPKPKTKTTGMAPLLSSWMLQRASMKSYWLLQNAPMKSSQRALLVQLTKTMTKTT
ncbi:hypothetical protein NC653_002172 [Populus alba x Populus x berolinensis]|uniref:Secreted protein n=1 Tax=Populus alba x Populus x berolinensis TaxID=444605 RepID=A0AAD6RN07_9ROSI|nr:hypothetical protein NC653_002172 [Populus alba x Populus x berolinensis]